MIAELTAAMTAIRETAQIAKLMNEAKTQAEVNAAMGELNSKLASIQRECVSLVELVGSYQEMNASLKAKIAEFEDFKSESEGYALDQLPAGTLVYSKKHVMNAGQVVVHACPKCFLEKKISMLQPGPSANRHYQLFCPSCNTTFRRERFPEQKSRVISYGPLR